jgi:hypothetical protein
MYTFFGAFLGERAVLVCVLQTRYIWYKQK